MPIPVITVDEMRSWEAATWSAGILEAAVIDQVGQAIANWLLPRTRSSDSILVVAGRGHNGDDGRTAAKYLVERQPSIIEISDPAADIRHLEEALTRHPTVILDCLFGIGINRDLSPQWSAIVDRINRSPATMIAIDVPSGLNAQTGRPMGSCIEADYTLTVGAAKSGMLAPSAQPFVGYIRVLHDVGLTGLPARHEILFSQSDDFRHVPPPRRARDHKGNFGRLAIGAGSVGYHGAAVLAGRGAMRAQPGLITLSTAPDCYFPVAAQLQQVMVNSFGKDWQPHPKSSALLFGPGLAAPNLPSFLVDTLTDYWRMADFPVLVDASGLDWLPRGDTHTDYPRVITPHLGEAARLLDRHPRDVNENRVESLRELSAQFGGCWVVLKGAHSLVGRHQGPVFVNATGNPGLAQGGSGDVLAGFLAGLIAQPRCQADIETTLRLGVWKHGEAADQLQWERNNWTIEDLPQAIHT
ncbi:MAG: Bifunctional NAD(P)H-hydrate repair enzyme Nnr [Verrucomicrobia subdivision 3 bacterium]|nr:Bifunctional NAD(P)H-hydrate repair enzyme Nnr [Limisphaerales bacterium]MCS1413045.1 Bifunctional NAD(P)H-hydrate repair enzyme Nnr [Limisphaerales bacterium]